MVGSQLTPRGAAPGTYAGRVLGIASVLERLATIDVDLAAHAEATGVMAGRLASHLKLSVDDVADAVGIGMLHEAGALVVPQPPTAEFVRLADSEILRYHRLERDAAVRIVDADERIADLAGAVGSVFDDIVPTIAARIAVVADAYDYLVRTWRDRGAVPQADALRIVAMRAGARYDPRVVDALSSVVQEG